jgi:hypothetical protein
MREEVEVEAIDWVMSLDEGTRSRKYPMPFLDQVYPLKELFLTERHKGLASQRELPEGGKVAGSRFACEDLDDDLPDVEWELGVWH